MKTSTEIEFKTFISKEVYESLLEKYKQKDNILVQTNHYFDSKNEDLEKQKKVLRIRQKGSQYKLTKKSPGNGCNIENHVFLTSEQAKDMLKNGFDASIIDEKINVKLVGALTTHRSKMPYKSGYLFFDKSSYNGITDYEIEYEAPEEEKGKKEFAEFLESNHIEYKRSYSKFKRCMETRKK